MSGTSRLGMLFLSLGFTTAFILFLRTQFSIRRFIRILFTWSWNKWSFNAQWISQQQLVSFTIVYLLIGFGLLIETPISIIFAFCFVVTIGTTVGDRRVAAHARQYGVSKRETHFLSEWKFISSETAHNITRDIESGELNWVPSTLTFISIPFFASFIALGIYFLGMVFTNSGWMYTLFSSLVIAIPALLSCMLGPIPEIVKKSM